MSQSKNLGLICQRTVSGVKGRGVVATCSGGGLLSDKKAFYKSDMSRGRNNCQINIFSLSVVISGCDIDLVYGVQCKCKP